MIDDTPEKKTLRTVQGSEDKFGANKGGTCDQTSTALNSDGQSPVREDAERFLKALDPEATFFTFQTFDDNPERKDPRLAKLLHGSFSEVYNSLLEMYEKGAGIFVALNETDGAGRKDPNITRVRALFVDLDGSPLEPVQKARLKPHLITETSPGRWHCYWLVNDLPLEDFSKIQLALAKRFDSDASVCDLPRVIRLPGFAHRKRKPFLTRIVSIHDDPPYDGIKFKLQRQGTDDEGDEIDRACAEIRAAKEGERNATLNKMAFVLGQYVGAGAFDEKIVRSRLARAAKAAGLKDGEIKTTIQSGIEKGKTEPRQPGRNLPVIKVEAGELSSNVISAEEILLQSGVPLYQRAGQLVRPVVSTVDAAKGRKTTIVQLLPLDHAYMRFWLNEHIDFQKLDVRRKRWVSVNPPDEIAKTILSRVGNWKFPLIAGVITTPTLRPDGTILYQSGYDPDTRLLLVAPPDMPPIFDEPTKDDAVKALALLNDLLVEFPFDEDGVGRAVALSGLITPIVRGAFPVTPMHVARAPVSGSGKSYLWDVASAIATGDLMPVKSAGKTEEETEKRLGAALMTGQPLISIDNVNGELGGDALCQAIERSIVDIRILGKSELVRVEARGTTLFATGNNIIIVGDLCRRVITATLDPRVERPELREFKGNPVNNVLADRGAYIAAALTICRAYVVAGQPDKAKRLASFEGWSDTVRSALMWLGCADATKSIENTRDEDPELAALREMLGAWADVIGVGFKTKITLQEVIDIANEKVEAAPDIFRWPTLNAAVQGIGGGRQIDAKSLGRWTQRFKNRVADNFRLSSKSNPKGGSRWWVEHTDGKTEKPGKRGNEAAPPATGNGQHKDEPPVKLTMYIVRETEAAFLMHTDGGADVWLPKSQITTTPNGDDGMHVTVPAWLAMSKGLTAGGTTPTDPVRTDPVPF